jgi:hypothetical protein
MNAKTLEAVTRHGESLIKAFPDCSEKDPVILCKKLRRIETSLTKPLLDYCNGDFKGGESEIDEICDAARNRVVKLLFGFDLAKNPHPVCACGLFVNRDPRGCALKLSSEWTKEYNAREYSEAGKARHRNRRNPQPIYTDWGGYGLLAPDFTEGGR